MTLFFIAFFLSIVGVIALILAISGARAGRDVATGRSESIRWSLDFTEIPPAGRQCRQALTGEVPDRVCPNAFDCRFCSHHARFPRARADNGPDCVFGLRYPQHRYYHRGHTWVAPQPDGSLLVGLDAIGQRVIGEPDVVEMAPVGSKVIVNGEGWRMRKDGLAVRILCPVDGMVLETGGPEDDWYLRVQPATTPPDFGHLLRGEEVRAWVAREIERLQLAVAPQAAAALADGGVLVDDVLRELPESVRDAVLGEVFLEP